MMCGAIEQKKKKKQRSKACTQAGMRSIQECWHGKESYYPSVIIKKKVEQECEGVRK